MHKNEDITFQVILKEKAFECHYLITTQNTFLHKRKDLMTGFVNKSFYNEL